jgi:hypothetical protein
MLCCECKEQAGRKSAVDGYVHSIRGEFDIADMEMKIGRSMSQSRLEDMVPGQ